jgi:hypothetical protein
MWQKLSWKRCCREADRPTHVADRPGLGGELTSLPQIISCRHIERYSCGGLDPAGYKVGSVGQGVGQRAALLGPPSRGFGLQGLHGQRLTVVTLV